jgi:hypothetical protein
VGINMFKVGDLVKCIQSHGGIEAGKVYKVIGHDYPNVLRLEGLGINGYYDFRFEKYIQKFKLYQRVWSSEYGWGQVVEVNILEDRPLRVIFDDSSYSRVFTLDGKIVASALRPSLFVNEVPLEDWPDPDPVLDPTTLVEDQEIEVKLSEGEGWSKRKFAMMKNGAVWVYSTGKDSKTCKNMFKTVSFRLPKEENGV